MNQLIPKSIINPVIKNYFIRYIQIIVTVFMSYFIAFFENIVFVFPRRVNELLHRTYAQRVVLG